MYCFVLYVAVVVNKLVKKKKGKKKSQCAKTFELQCISSLFSLNFLFFSFEFPKFTGDFFFPCFQSPKFL